MFIPNSPSPPSGTINKEGLLNCVSSTLFLRFVRLSYHRPSEEGFSLMKAGRETTPTRSAVLRWDPVVRLSAQGRIRKTVQQKVQKLQQ